MNSANHQLFRPLSSTTTTTTTTNSVVVVTSLKFPYQYKTVLCKVP